MAASIVATSTHDMASAAPQEFVAEHDDGTVGWSFHAKNVVAMAEGIVGIHRRRTSEAAQQQHQEQDAEVNVEEGLSEPSSPSTLAHGIDAAAINAMLTGLELLLASSPDPPQKSILPLLQMDGPLAMALALCFSPLDDAITHQNPLSPAGCRQVSCVAVAAFRLALQCCKGAFAVTVLPVLMEIAITAATNDNTNAAQDVLAAALAECVSMANTNAAFALLNLVAPGSSGSSGKGHSYSLTGILDTPCTSLLQLCYNIFCGNLVDCLSFRTENRDGDHQHVPEPLLAIEQAPSILSRLLVHQKPIVLSAEKGICVALGCLRQVCGALDAMHAHHAATQNQQHQRQPASPTKRPASTSPPPPPAINQGWTAASIFVELLATPLKPFRHGNLLHFLIQKDMCQALRTAIKGTTVPAPTSTNSSLTNDHQPSGGGARPLATVLSALDSRGCTPLAYAILRHSPIIVRLCLLHGASPLQPIDAGRATELLFTAATSMNHHHLRQQRQLLPLQLATAVHAPQPVQALLSQSLGTNGAEEDEAIGVAFQMENKTLLPPGAIMDGSDNPSAGSRSTSVATSTTLRSASTTARAAGPYSMHESLAHVEVSTTTSLILGKVAHRLMDRQCSGGTSGSAMTPRSIRSLPLPILQQVGCLCLGSLASDPWNEKPAALLVAVARSYALSVLDEGKKGDPFARASAMSWLGIADDVCSICHTADVASDAYDATAAVEDHEGGEDDFASASQRGSDVDDEELENETERQPPSSRRQSSRGGGSQYDTFSAYADSGSDVSAPGTTFSKSHVSRVSKRSSKPKSGTASTLRTMSAAERSRLAAVGVRQRGPSSTLSNTKTHGGGGTMGRSFSATKQEVLMAPDGTCRVIVWFPMNGATPAESCSEAGCPVWCVLPRGYGNPSSTTHAFIGPGVAQGFPYQVGEPIHFRFVSNGPSHSPEGTAPTTRRRFFVKSLLPAPSSGTTSIIVADDQCRALTLRQAICPATQPSPGSSPSPALAIKWLSQAKSFFASLSVQPEAGTTSLTESTANKSRLYNDWQQLLQARGGHVEPTVNPTKAWVFQSTRHKTLHQQLVHIAYLPPTAHQSYIHHQRSSASTASPPPAPLAWYDTNSHYLAPVA